MAHNIQELEKRLASIEGAINYNLRIRKEKTHDAWVSLMRIPAEQKELICEEIPAMREIFSYSEDDLIANRRNVQQVLSKLVMQYAQKVEAELKYFEDTVC